MQMKSEGVLKRLAVWLIVVMAILGAVPFGCCAEAEESYWLQVSLTLDGNPISSPEELYALRSRQIKADILAGRTGSVSEEKAMLYCGVYQGERLLSVCETEVVFREDEMQKKAALTPDLSEATAEDLSVRFYLWQSGTQRPLARATEAFSDSVRIFVSSKGGDDSNSGSVHAPVKTIRKARDIARNKPQRRVDVFLREGDYFESVLFNGLDQRRQDCPLTIQPFCGEEARLIGAVPLDGGAFTAVSDPAAQERIPAEARDKVRRISLPEQGITEYGEIVPIIYGQSAPTSPELFINRSAMTLSRWPNDDYARIESVTDNSNKSFSFTAAGAFERIKYWANAKDVWAYGSWYWDWASGSVKLTDIDASTGFITATVDEGIRNGQKFYVYNLLEELDQPGEFYLDRTDGTLYVYPQSEITAADDILFSLNTNPLLEFQYSSNIHVRGLEIGYTRGQGIRTNRADDISLQDCTLLCTGQIGIYAEESTKLTVSGCTITETGAGGIQCSGGDFTALTSSGNLLTNNHIYRYARLVKSYTPAFRIAGVGTTVSHNLIHDAEHNAIMYGGNDHVIEYNEIYNVCTNTDDSGAIYAGLSWSDRGNVVRYNYLHDIVGQPGGYGVCGVYLDDMHSSTEIYGNIFYRVTKPVLIGGGRDNVVENNLILEATEHSGASVVIDQRGVEDWFAGNIGTLTSYLNAVPYRSEVWRTRYPALYTMLDNNAPGEPCGNAVKNNLIYRHKGMGISPLVEQYGSIENNFITDQEDVGFVDYANRNFAIKDDSILFETIPGFRKIPIEDIGLLDKK
jgi:hypothetical protein